MPKPKGTPKTGGRKRGTPNRKTAEIAEKLAALDCDPVAGMATLAMDKSSSPELRGRMFAELAQYVYPKRKAIEHSGSLMERRNVQEMSDEELVAIARLAVKDVRQKRGRPAVEAGALN